MLLDRAAAAREVDGSRGPMSGTHTTRDERMETIFGLVMFGMGFLIAFLIWGPV